MAEQQLTQDEVDDLQRGLYGPPVRHQSQRSRRRGNRLQAHQMSRIPRITGYRHDPREVLQTPPGQDRMNTFGSLSDTDELNDRATTLYARGGTVKGKANMHQLDIHVTNQYAAGRPQRSQSPQQQAITRTRQIVERLQRGGPHAAGALNLIGFAYHELADSYSKRDPHRFEAAKLELARAFTYWFERT